MHTSLNYI